jgi:hypothetical protein
MRTELDGLRQELQARGGNAEAQGRRENPHLMHTLRNMQRELDDLRQRAETPGENAAAHDRPVDPEVQRAQDDLDRRRTLSRMAQEARDLELAEKMQEAEHKRALAELKNQELEKKVEMEQATAGWKFIEQANQAAERLIR